MDEIPTDKADETISILVQKLYAISDLPLDISEKGAFQLKYTLITKALQDAARDIFEQIKAFEAEQGE